jgi:aldehyde dehydrogenase (NAD+)
MVSDSGIVAGVSDSKTDDVQREWAGQPVAERLAILRGARQVLAGEVRGLCAAISSELARNDADTMAAEILPLLEACKFLEREAGRLLKVRRLGRRGLPFWLSGIDAQVHRVALGRVLLVGTGNYPLFLPGVQAMQALAAGNSVVWKPGGGGRKVAEVFAGAMTKAGLPEGLLRVTDETVEAAEREIDAGVDKVFFTGSAATGRVLLRRLAETLTPCVVESSGCDAVVVLPSADMARVVEALAFGMRLNGSATCMAPRRLILAGLTAEQRAKLISNLLVAFSAIAGIRLAGGVARQLDGLLEAAIRDGAFVHGDRQIQQKPIVVTNVLPGMAIAQADIFAPLLTVIETKDEGDLLAAMDGCPYSLTAAIFGDERMARQLAAKIVAGSVLVNDLIVPTADPRVPFGGRRQSGFGVTRGAEGLLEMTAVKVVSVRRGSSTRHFEATSEDHAALFEGAIRAGHSATWNERWRGVRMAIAAGRKLR